MALMDLSTASLVSTPLAGSKLDDLAQELAASAKAEGASSPEAWGALIEREQHRYATLAEIIAPGSPVSNALSETLEKRQAALFPAGIPPEEASAMARQEVMSIFNNRRNDALAAVTMLQDAAWVEATRQGIAEGRIQPPDPNAALSAEKLDEQRRQLLGVLPMPEPAVHILFSAIGHQLGHRALAEAFAPGGEGEALFLTEMQKRLPADPSEALAAFDSRWLALRGHRAALVADVLKPEGKFVQETIAESERRRCASPVPMVGGAVTTAEAPITIQPQTIPPETILPEPHRASLMGRLWHSVFGGKAVPEAGRG